jgi:hypothetical protein
MQPLAGLEHRSGGQSIDVAGDRRTALAAQALSAVLNGRAGVSAAMALRLEMDSSAVRNFRRRAVMLAC